MKRKYIVMRRSPEPAAMPGFALWHRELGISVCTVQASEQQAAAILDKHPEKKSDGWRVMPVTVQLKQGERND